MISLAALRRSKGNVICIGTHPGIIQSMLDYDYMCGRQSPSVLAIISSGRKQERYFWGESEIEVPVFASVEVLPSEVREAADAVLMVQSARRVLTAIKSALPLLSKVRIVTIFAEQVPERHARELIAFARKHKVLITGPASVGFLLPGILKLGAIGGTQHPQIGTLHITQPGDTAVISTSGGMVNELMHMVVAAGKRVSFAVALGGDRYPILRPAEAFMLAQNDPATKQIVYFGELGGDDEYEIAQLIKDGAVTKKVSAYIAGEVADLFETPPQFGHAKALAQSDRETASAKKAALREAGANVTVADRFADLADALAAGKAKPVQSQEPARTIGERHKRLIASHVSGEKDGRTHLLGRDMVETISGHNSASLAISLLLGRQVTNKKLIEFTDFTMRVLADHGPYVSGAVNTIVTARAGRDLVSSLAAGLLAIGPRFGGAINEAAGNWLEGARSGDTAKEFVESFVRRGGIIPGIGHKKYSLDTPDPRLQALGAYAGNKNGDRYLTFALGVQAITTTKKRNLILNVDGMIAAMLLDILESELHYTPQQLKELVDIEFFNSLFVISRTIGFTAHYLDQRRHDEGLLRLSPQDISYIA